MTPITRSNREHSFDWELAVIVGLEKAILLKNISYWCEENRRRAIAEYFQHGEWWTRESVRSLEHKYPYFTKTSILRWMNQLCAAGWVRMFGQTGGTNFYAPGEVFNAWNSGADWKLLADSRLRGVSQNGTPCEVSQNGTPLSQNGTPPVPKWYTGCPKMGHTNSDVEKQMLSNVEGARAPKKPASIRQRKSDTLMPSTGTAARPTTFAESAWANESAEAWRVALVIETNIPDLDAAWYFNRVKDWSAERASTSANWIVTAGKFARDDQRKQKLVTLQPIGHDQRNDNNPGASRSSAAKPRFSLELSTPAQLEAAAAQLLARRSRRNQYGSDGN